MSITNNTKNHTSNKELKLYEFTCTFGFDFFEHDGLSEKFRELISKLLKIISIDYFDEKKYYMPMWIKEIKQPNRRYTPEKCYLQYSLDKPQNKFLYGRVEPYNVVTVFCTQEEEKQVREILVEIYNLQNEYSYNNQAPAITIEDHQNKHEDKERGIFVELAKDLDVPNTTPFEKVDEHGVLYPSTEHCIKTKKKEVLDYENDVKVYTQMGNTKRVELRKKGLVRINKELSYFQSLKQYKHLNTNEF